MNKEGNYIDYSAIPVTKLVIEAIAICTIITSTVILVFKKPGNTESEYSLFGDIPEIYEKQDYKIKRLIEDIYSKKGNGEKICLDDILGLFTEMQDLINKTEKEALTYAEKIKDRKILFTANDSLPYRIISDIRLLHVKLPETAIINGQNKPLGIEIYFKALITEKTQTPLRLAYNIMKDQTVVGYGSTTEYGYPDIGDTINIMTTVYAPDIPAEQLKSCNSLKFITECTYK